MKRLPTPAADELTVTALKPFNPMKQRRSAKSSGSGSSSSGGSKCGRNSGRVYASPEPSLQETTFHGLNHAVSGASACTRRVLWILLILVAVAGLVSVFVEKVCVLGVHTVAVLMNILLLLLY